MKQKKIEEIGIRELKSRASEVARAVKEKRAQYVVTQRGMPAALLIPLDALVAAKLAQFASEVAAKYRLRGSDSVYTAVALRFGTELVTLNREQLERLPKVLKVKVP